MSQTLYGDIRAALTQRLVDMPSLPQVAWENTSYVPTLGTPYLTSFVLWGEGSQAELGENGRNWERGIYQITMDYPQGDGPGDQNAMAGLIRDWFKRGTVLTYNGVTVTVRKVYLNPQGNVVSIAWYCNAEN